MADELPNPGSPSEREIRSRLPIRSMTEFLTKSLMAAGVILSIPAGLSAVLAARMLWATWPRGIGICLGWITFCAIGFSLLGLTIRAVYSPNGIHRQRAVWIGVAAYLAVILTGAGMWLVSTYRVAARVEREGYEAAVLTTDFLSIAALLLIIPFWAFILSIILCFRPTESGLSSTPSAPVDESI
jgi:hypothetical protein